MKYLVLAAGLLVMAAVLAALLLLPAPTAGPLPSPSASGAVGSDKPDASAAASVQPSANADTGEDTGDGFTPLPPRTTPEPSLAVSSAPPTGIDPCSLFDVAQVERLTDLAVEDEVAPTLNVEPVPDPAELWCEYRDDQERTLLQVNLAAPEDNAAAAMREDEALAREAGLSWRQLTDSDGAALPAALSSCPSCAGPSSSNVVVYLDRATVSLTISQGPERGGLESAIALTAALLDED